MNSCSKPGGRFLVENCGRLLSISIILLILASTVAAHTTTEPSKSPVRSSTDFKKPGEEHKKPGEEHGNNHNLLSFLTSLIGLTSEDGHAHIEREEKISKRKAASWVMQTYRVNVVNRVFYVKKAVFRSITESQYPSFYQMKFDVLSAEGWKNKTVLVDKTGEKVYFSRSIKFPENYEVKKPGEVLNKK